MAIYKRDIASINLETGTIHRTFLNHSIGYKDQKADHFGIRVFRDGEPVDLTGVSVQGVFMPPQGDPIAITSGNIVSGNEAEVVLPQACYNYDGQFCLAIKLVDSNNSVTGTMRIVDGMVDNTHASGTVAPTSAVPTYQEILSTYDAMVAATAAANGAIAATYSSSSTYKVGDYCIHDGGLYRCTTAITTAEAWTSGHWTAAKIGPDVSDLKSALNDEEKTINYNENRLGNLDGEIYPNRDVFDIGNIYISNSGWSYTNSANMVRVKNGSTINLSAGDKITLSDYTNARFKVGWRVGATYGFKDGWQTQDYICTVTGEYVIVISNITEAAQANKYTLSDLLVIKKSNGGLIEEFYTKTNRVLKEDYTAASRTHKGVVFTVQADGGVAYERTSTDTSDAFFNLTPITYAKAIQLEAGKTYRVHGGANPYVQMVLLKVNSGDSLSTALSGFNYTFTALEGYRYAVRITISRSLANGSSGTVYPVITASNDYSFANETPQENFDSVLRTERNNKFYDNILLFNNNRNTVVFNGITYTPQSDGSVTVSGTATANSDYNIIEPNIFDNCLKLIDGQVYTFNTGNSDVLAYVLEATSDGVFTNVFEAVPRSIASFPAKTGKRYGFRLFVKSGTTVSATIKPTLNLGYVPTEFIDGQDSQTQANIIQSNIQKRITENRRADIDSIENDIKLADINLPSILPYLKWEQGSLSQQDGRETPDDHTIIQMTSIRSNFFYAKNTLIRYNANSESTYKVRLYWYNSNKVYINVSNVPSDGRFYAEGDYFRFTVERIDGENIEPSDIANLSVKMQIIGYKNGLSLRVATHNVRNFGTEHVMGYDGNISQQTFYNTLYESVNADLIGFQEYSPWLDHPNHLYPSAELFSNLYNQIAYGHYDLPNASRIHLQDVEGKLFSTGRKYKTAKAIIDGKEIFIANVHPSPGFEESHIATRATEYQEIVTMLNGHDTFIVTGDFNTVQASELDVFVNAGYTLANDGTIVTVKDYAVPCDNIIVSPNITMTNVTKYPDIGNSDHYLLYCDLVIPLF